MWGGKGTLCKVGEPWAARKQCRAMENLSAAHSFEGTGWFRPSVARKGTSHGSGGFRGFIASPDESKGCNRVSSGYFITFIFVVPSSGWFIDADSSLRMRGLVLTSPSLLFAGFVLLSPSRRILSYPTSTIPYSYLNNAPLRKLSKIYSPN